MPQEHYVLKCYSCETFQVHIAKKAKKWECKMCGAKQSVKRNYGKGSGKDCRNQVMKLNERRLMDGCNSNIADDVFFDDNFTDPELKVESNPNKTLTSKWEKYLEEPLALSENELDDCMTDIYTDSEEKKKKRVKKMSEDSVNKNKKICRESNVNNISPKVISPLYSPIGENKNFESCNINETPIEKKCQIQIESKLKFNKYAKFLDSDDEHDDGKGNKSGEEKDINKLSNIFDSDPNDLDNIFSLE